MTTTAFSHLIDQLAKTFAAEPQADGPLTAAALRSCTSDFGRQPPCAFDDGIRVCLAGSADPVARALFAAQDWVPWGANPVAKNMTPTAANMIAVSTLMGPEGPIPSRHYLFGLLYMVPDAYYPLHDHDADETYVVIAGGADWTAGDDRRWRGAGDMVHHPSLLPHAFRTGRDGMVALWRWSGDINTHSYRFLPDPATVPAAAQM